MKAWQLVDGKLEINDIPLPKASAGEVLIRVLAAGVIRTELGWYPTTHTKTGDPRSLPVPGHEFSGIVEAIGSNVVGITVGDEVYGMNDWFSNGATAEFCITRPQWVAAKPKTLSPIQAASVPISGLTAWQALFDHARLQSDDRVLIHGGAGGVGTFAIQLAKRHGAQVITSASARNTDFLRQLGALQVIDYHTQDFEKLLSNVDVVIDTIGGDTLHKSWKVLTPTGRLVTVASDSENRADEKSKKAFFIVEPKRDQLEQVAQLLDSKQIQTFVDAVVPFEMADDAYTRQIKPRLGYGKVVVDVNQ